VLIFRAILVELNAKDSALVEDNAFVHLLAMMEINAPVMLVLKELEEMDVSTAQSAVTTLMLAPTISVSQLLDANTPLLLALLQMLAPLPLVIKLLDAKTNQRIAVMEMFVLLIIATMPLDANILLFLAINA